MDKNITDLMLKDSPKDEKLLENKIKRDHKKGGKKWKPL